MKREIKKPYIIAHRGAKSLAKVENTIESFQIAIDHGISMIEFDVRKTKDNKLIIFHNDYIHGKKLFDLTYEELCHETLLEDYMAPLFTDVLKLCKNKIKLDIEIKETGYVPQILKEIKENFSFGDIIITSFHDEVLLEIKETKPEIKVGLLIGLEQATLKQRLNEIFPIHRIKKCHADFIVPHYRLVTRYLIAKCNYHKMGIYVWTVNSPEMFKKLCQLNITAVITDVPQVFKCLKI